VTLCDNTSKDLKASFLATAARAYSVTKGTIRARILWHALLKPDKNRLYASTQSCEEDSYLGLLPDLGFPSNPSR
jgi:hypothetical protein